MAAPSVSNSEALAKLLRDYDNDLSQRGGIVSKRELKLWTPAELTLLLRQLQPQKKWRDEPCGPAIHSSSWKWVFFKILILIMAILVTIFWIPFQLYAGMSLLRKRRLPSNWRDLNKPNKNTFIMTKAWFKNVKAPSRLIEEAAASGAALCVNRNGDFSVRKKDYAVMSHVWNETCALSYGGKFRPLPANLRKKGVHYLHFLKFFDRCEHEWLWVDFLAMPEMFEDMSSAEKTEVEELRTKIINTLSEVYSRADKVVVIDSLLLNLDTASNIDVAVVLCLGQWMFRMWTLTEAKLAKKVVLKTRTSSFDMDEVLRSLWTRVQNDQHRYFQLLRRLWVLRPIPKGNFKSTMGTTAENQTETGNFLMEIYYANDNRSTKVEIDKIRSIFPLLGLEWTAGWTLHQGIEHVKKSFPEHQKFVEFYCASWGIKL